MFECFKKPTPPPKIVEPEVPVETIGPVDNTPIALIVGHNAKAQGAVNYLGESEYVFNSRVAEKVALKVADKGVRVTILKRPAGVGYNAQIASIVKQAKMLDVRYALSLHFNYATPTAKGVEVLIKDTREPDDNLIAQHFSNLINTEFGFNKRHSGGVKTIYKGHDGYVELLEMYKVGILDMILEPVFASNRNEAKVFFENEDKYVDILVDCCVKMATGTFLQES
jgi:N-acetylmuramoyl-L-alanine amidase